MSFKECAYCNGVADTEDHIPSKNLFLPEKRNEVRFVKIPACKACNNSFSKDEEYLRILFTTIGFEKSVKARELFRSKVLSSIEKRPSLGKLLLKEMSLVDTFKKSGEFVGQRAKVNINTITQNRIFSVIDRYVKGLFFYHHNVKIPNNYNIRHIWTDENNPTFSKDNKLIEKLNWFVENRPTFIYGFSEIPDSFQGIWVFEFFDHILFLSFIFLDSSPMAEVAKESLFRVDTGLTSKAPLK